MLLDPVKLNVQHTLSLHNTGRMARQTPRKICVSVNSKLLNYVIVCQMHLADYIITLVSVRVCVCPPIGCRTITSAILYRFSPNFACRSEMQLFRMLLFLGQTGSSLPILEMCKVRFWQFCDCGAHIFTRIVRTNPNEM